MFELRKRFIESSNNNKKFEDAKDNLLEKCKGFKYYLSSSFCMKIDYRSEGGSSFIYAFSMDSRIIIKFNIENMKYALDTLAVDELNECTTILGLP